MDEKRQIAQELDAIQQAMKELEMRYEKYFAGAEKREPYNERKALERRLRHFTNRRIVWTDLKFRYQNIASRFMSYGQYWDRILRLIDEGKFHRPSASRPASRASVQQEDPDTEANRLQQELSRARDACGLSGAAPSTRKVADFLASQREKIRTRYGDRPVEFSIDTSGEKPRIKVSLKK